jgi:hypothetical protein
MIIFFFRKDNFQFLWASFGVKRPKSRLAGNNTGLVLVVLEAELDETLAQVGQQVSHVADH